MLDREALESTAPACVTGTNAGQNGELALFWAFPLPAPVATRAHQERLLLGRGDDCDVILTGAEASRHHAELVRMSSLWVLRDLNSTNGIFLNGDRVQHAPLSDGDVLRLGDWVGVVGRLAGPIDEKERSFHQLAPDLCGGVRFQAAVAQARQVAKGCVRIIVEGETGTGKERVARAIHQWSGRSGQFVGVNCASLAEGLVEAELFGHRKGAFTGADRASLGYLRAAHGGTLLLDEITEMPLNVQAKLLRALEERAVVPVGESAPVAVDVRVIAASQEPLRMAVSEGRFRADLCARLSGLTVVLPPVRERREDVPGLFALLLARYSSRLPVVQARMVEQLCLYSWPFNVREIDQLACHLAELHGHEQVLRSSHLPEHLRIMVQSKASLQANPIAPRASVGRAEAAEASGRHTPIGQWPTEPKEIQKTRELAVLTATLAQHGGNLASATRALGISRQRAYRLLESLPEAERGLMKRNSGPRGGKRTER